MEAMAHFWIIFPATNLHLQGFFQFAMLNNQMLTTIQQYIDLFSVHIKILISSHYITHEWSSYNVDGLMTILYSNININLGKL